MSVYDTNARARSGAFDILSGHFGVIARRSLDWWNYRRTVRALNALTCEELDDIGISRADIKYAARYGRR